MEKRQTEMKQLKPGGFVIIDDVCCTVESIDISKSGKHGAAKARISAMGMFDGKRRVIVKPGDSRVDIPVLEKRNGQVISKTATSVQVMDLEDYAISELPVPEGLTLNEGDEVLIWRFGPNAMIKGKK